MHTADPRSSLWTATACPVPETPPLAGERRADVVVVGGGYTGLSAALHLAEAGVDAVVLEADAPGFGASGRNNGQVIPAYGRHNPDDVARELGEERGERLNRWVAGSADLVFDLIRRHGIDCDAVQAGWVQPAHAEGRLAMVRTKYEQWAKRGVEVELLDRAATEQLTGSPIYHGAWLHRRGGNIQPLSYARGLAAAALKAGAAIHGGSPAVKIDRSEGGWRVATSGGAVTAEHVILATNAYTDRLWPGLRQEVVSVRSFQIATRPLGHNVRRTILPGGHGISDSRTQLWAFRYDRDGRLVTTGFPLVPAGARGGLERSSAVRFRRVFPQIGDPGIDYVWEGRIAMTVDRLPRYHELAAGVHTTIGYSGRGIALATAAGKMMAERVRGVLADDELPLPRSDVRPIPMHDLVAPLARAMTLVYRWRDARA